MFYTKNEQGRYVLNGSFTQLVSDIASIIGWKPVDTGINGVIDLTNKGQVIRFTIKTQIQQGQVSNPKISVSCLIERRYIPDAVLNQYTTAINVSANRGADAIAKDIQKRILPDCFKLWALGEEYKQKENNCKTKLKNKTQQLADILRTHPHPNDEGNTISESLKLKPEVGQQGINLDAKDYINLKAEVRLDDDIDDVKITTTLPYELAIEFFQWLADKTVDCYEIWHQKMIDHCFMQLNKEAKAAGQPEVKELPPNNFNWKKAYLPSSMGDTHSNKHRLYCLFKQSIIELVKPVEETIEQKVERLSLPYDNGALMRLHKRIGYATNPAQMKDDLNHLSKQLDGLCDWITQLLENGVCNEFPDFFRDVERRDLIEQLINKSIQQQPQVESQPATEPTATTREDEIKEIFKNSHEVEILCRLSLHTPSQYREVLKDELLRIRDRRILRTKLEEVRKAIKDDPSYLKRERPRRILEILEQLDQLHSEIEINLLIRVLKKRFPSFKEAKLATNTKAASWQKLAEKLAA